MITEKDYTNPYGTWEVTTEGDCEGRSTRNLGVYVGYLDDIAFALADKCCYSLRFTKICTDIPVPKSARENVSVSLDIQSKTWDMDEKDRVAYFRQLLCGRNNVSVTDGQFYASVILHRKDLERTKKEIALAKLTDEEKILLGLLN